MLEDLKEQVCEANLELVRQGLVTLTWGNVSGINADRDILVIKPSGVPYDGMHPGQMVAVRIDTGEALEGQWKPSSDTPTHRILYQQFSGIGGITHTHSVKATTFAQARQEIPCYGTTHADHFYGTVPVTRPLSRKEIEEAYEANTARVIVERFSDLDSEAMPAVLVASHAPFTWGKNAMESVKNAIALESVANMAMGTLALNRDVHPVEPYLLDKHYLRKHGKDAYYGQR
ncbi:MAG: L-ribulose-5-phosphate 4-epimerase AraD [Pirellulaceae bacterium]